MGVAWINPSTLAASAIAAERSTTAAAQFAPKRLLSLSASAVARALYATVKDLPIVSPHGHTDPQWFADDTPFGNASAVPGYYCARMAQADGVTRIFGGDGGAGRDGRTRELARARGH